MFKIFRMFTNHMFTIIDRLGGPGPTATEIVRNICVEICESTSNHHNNGMSVTSQVFSWQSLRSSRQTEASKDLALSHACSAQRLYQYSLRLLAAVIWQWWLGLPNHKQRLDSQPHKLGSIRHLMPVRCQRYSSNGCPCTRSLMLVLLLATRCSSRFSSKQQNYSASFNAQGLGVEFGLGFGSLRV